MSAGALKTIIAWQHFAIVNNRGGASNLFEHEGVRYSFTPFPEVLQNGALRGRIHRWLPGEAPHDVGGYKIAADGRVEYLPAELHGVLPYSGEEVECESCMNGKIREEGETPEQDTWRRCMDCGGTGRVPTAKPKTGSES